MKQFWFQIIALLIVIFAALAISFNPNFSSSILPFIKVGDTPSSTPQTRQLQIIDESLGSQEVVKAVINIEVADDKNKRSKGLGGRASLDPNSGMLFIFEKEDIYKFWMKGVNFPLDFIWISGDRVADILPNVPPASANTPDSSLPIYAPVVKVDRVLEVNAGFAQAHGIKVGDRLKIAQ